MRTAVIVESFYNQETNTEIIIIIAPWITDLRSLADSLAATVPALTGPIEERPKTKSWWQFWK